jgi:hypothetical protein
VVLQLSVGDFFSPAWRCLAEAASRFGQLKSLPQTSTTPEPGHWTLCTVVLDRQTLSVIPRPQDRDVRVPRGRATCPLPREAHPAGSAPPPCFGQLAPALGAVHHNDLDGARQVQHEDNQTGEGTGRLRHGDGIARLPGNALDCLPRPLRSGRTVSVRRFVLCHSSTSQPKGRGGTVAGRACAVPEIAPVCLVPARRAAARH